MIISADHDNYYYQCQYQLKIINEHPMIKAAIIQEKKIGYKKKQQQK